MIEEQDDVVKAGKEFQQQVSDVVSYSPPFCVSPGNGAWLCAVGSWVLLGCGWWQLLEWAWLGSSPGEEASGVEECGREQL